MVTPEQKAAAKAIKAAFKARGVKLSVKSFSGRAQWVQARNPECFSVADRMAMIAVCHPGMELPEGRTTAGNTMEHMMSATPAEWAQFLAAVA